MSFNRMQETAIKLVADLGIDGTDHDHLTEPTIHPRDAVRFVIKTIRELRYQIGLGGSPDLPGTVAKVAAHLGRSVMDAEGKTKVHIDADSATIAAALSAEAATFAAETEERLGLMGGHGVFTVDEGYLDRRQLPDGVAPKDRVI